MINTCGSSYLLGPFLAARSDRQRDRDDEWNLFHRDITSFDLPDCATSPAIKRFPSVCKIIVRVSPGGSPKKDSMPAIAASSRALIHLLRGHWARVIGHKAHVTGLGILLCNALPRFA